MQNPLADDERQELSALKRENQRLQRELDEIKNDINKEVRSRELELILDGLRGKIQNPRREKSGFCWYFGQDGVEADYGSTFDDPGYWRLLLTLDSSCGETLLNTDYRHMERICEQCQTVIEEMRQYRKKWLKLHGVLKK